MLGRMLQMFDRHALQRALEAKRGESGLTWSDVRREINAIFKDVPGHRPIAMATITGLGLEADGILQLLIWLNRTPESFVPGFPNPDADRYRLPRLESHRILRTDTKALFDALDAERKAKSLSWSDLAREFGVGASSLTGLAKGGRANMQLLTLAAGWLGKPCAAFTRASAW